MNRGIARKEYAPALSLMARTVYRLTWQSGTSTPYPQWFG
jgi:hypothetical protein